MLDEMITPCKCCLESQFTYYLKLIDMNKLIEARKKAMINNETVIYSIEMPMLLGSKGHVNYIFDGIKLNKNGD